MKTRNRFVLVLAMMAVVTGLSAEAATLKVLSTGAVAEGMQTAVSGFRAASGHDVKLTFRTGPQVARSLEAGERWDLVVATPPANEKFTKSGVLSPNSVVLGRVGIGVAVRKGARVPKIDTVDDFKREVLAADAVAFSRGSTGEYAERLLKQLGLYDRVRERIIQEERGEDAMRQIAALKGNEIVLGALTEIAQLQRGGITLVAPLPNEIQSYTTYIIAPMTPAGESEAVQSRAAESQAVRSQAVRSQAVLSQAVAAFVSYLKSPAGRAAFREAGVSE